MPYARFFSQRSTDERLQELVARQYLFCCYLALSSFFDTAIPRNEGTYRCVKIIAPKAPS